MVLTRTLRHSNNLRLFHRMFLEQNYYFCRRNVNFWPPHEVSDNRLGHVASRSCPLLKPPPSVRGAHCLECRLLNSFEPKEEV